MKLIAIDRNAPEAIRALPVRVEALEPRQLFSVITVDDDRAEIPNAQFTKIQQAVNAAKKGDTIRVAPGRYTTAIVITGSAKDNLTIYSDRNKQATIDPPAGTGSAVKIDGADNVTLRNFAINGPDLQFGVTIVGGGSATIVGNRIKSVRNNPLDGVNSGFGIYVSNGSGTLLNNAIYDYQKAGIVVGGATSHATINGNTVTGVGPTGLLAQVGIQISRGANGSIDGNAVRNNAYTGTDVAAAGILLADVDLISVTNNDLDGNDENLSADASSNLTISGNTATNGTYDGIALFGVTGSLVHDNACDHNGIDGIYVDDASSDNQIMANVLDSDGLYDAEDISTGSGTGGTANTWGGNTLGTKNVSGLA